MTTREKLAAVLEALHKSGTHAARPLALDALEAIVREARNEALTDAENACEGVYSFFGCRGESAEGASHCVLDVRALKVSK